MSKPKRYPDLIVQARSADDVAAAVRYAASNKLKVALRSGGLAAWSIRHPVGVTMIFLAVIVLGVFSLGKLAIDLNPHIIYPEIRVRVIDPGVPATVMEDQITRQLEEQLAITEDAIAVPMTPSVVRWIFMATMRLSVLLMIQVRLTFLNSMAATGSGNKN